MKFLLLSLIVLSSCGQNSMPKAKDLTDSDGDEISDGFDKNKYESDLTNLGQIQGRMKVNLLSGSEVYDFSNKASTRRGILKRLTTGKNSQWGDLDFETSQLSVLTQDSYKVDLQFTVVEEKPINLIIKDLNHETVVASWAKDMQIDLSHDQLSDILSGRSHFKLSRAQPDFEKNLNQKTYEVYMDDGARSSLKNIAFNMSFEDFMNSQGITAARQFVDMDILFEWPADKMVWWYQRSSKQSYTLVYASVSTIKESLLENFTERKFDVVRSNGQQNVVRSIVSRKGASYFFRVRGSKTLNVFEGSYTIDVHSDFDSFGSFSCRYDWYKATGVRVVPVTTQELRDEVRVITNTNVLTLTDVDAQIVPRNDKDGVYWEIGFKMPESNVKLSLASLDDSTYETTGIVKSSCDSAHTPSNTQARTSSENNLTLSIESFIEKMD